MLGGLGSWSRTDVAEVSDRLGLGHVVDVLLAHALTGIALSKLVFGNEVVEHASVEAAEDVGIVGLSKLDDALLLLHSVQVVAEDLIWVLVDEVLGERAG